MTGSKAQCGSEAVSLCTAAILGDRLTELCLDVAGEEDGTTWDQSSDRSSSHDKSKERYLVARRVVCVQERRDDARLRGSGVIACGTLIERAKPGLRGRLGLL